MFVFGDSLYEAYDIFELLAIVPANACCIVLHAELSRFDELIFLVHSVTADDKTLIFPFLVDVQAVIANQVATL